MLVNNAGVAQGKLIIDLKPEDVYQYVELHLILSTGCLNTTFRTFGVNTLAHFWTLKAFLPGMIKNKVGHIVSFFLFQGEAL
jgi:NADP-dependent 3-hydroxy acid dehydrogenase YdfG